MDHGWLADFTGRNHDDEMDEDNEDFYGYGAAITGDAGAGAMETVQDVVPIPGNTQTIKVEQATVSTEDRKAENQRKADLLRAKLMAKMHNTPRQSTPTKTLPKPDTPSKQPPVVLQQDTADAHQGGARADNAPSSDALGLESLLAEGRAAAATKNMQSQGRPTVKLPPAPAVTQTHPSGNTKPVAQLADTEETQQRPLPEKQPATAATTDNSNKPPTKLNDPYYADLPAWLEVTGYHDVEYRNSKLRIRKEKRALEEQAAQIAKRLEQMHEEEQINIAQLRASTAHPTITTEQAAPPPLPVSMPSEDAAVLAAVANRLTNGVKRPHSPVPVEKVGRRRDESAAGFRIRGATNDTPTKQSPLSLDRRLSYSDGRRRSRDEPASRDPSLERRQAYYNGNAMASTGYRRDDVGPRYEQYTARDSRETPRSAHHRSGNARYTDIGRSGGYRDLDAGYRGSAGLDLRKGGVRYFMIKSWNHENVTQSMHDGLWATQTKNEKALTEAYYSARHVILCFSVNKSMAFQGYALMTSPPDPKLPKPSFCTKLNWSTSAPFTLRWLATTPVHFRMVGHLKNTCNVDDVTGEPRAVLVGKDGQEISNDAGMGVAWVLDEAEALERPMFPS